jgi:hypothetical protein
LNQETQAVEPSRTHAPQSESGLGDAIPGANLGSDVLAALRDANRERVVGHRTRRVVQSSLGVLRERQQDRSRVRSVALAVTVVVLLLIAPLLWEATDSLIAGEHLGDPGNQWSLWACIACPTLLAAAVVAGWWRHRS